MVRTLCLLIPALNEKVDDLLMQLPLFLSKIPEVPEIESASSDFELAQSNAIQTWWKNKRILTYWIDVVAVAVLLQPSSGSAERVFSMYSWMFDEEQDNALEDYKATALKMRFNEQDRRRV